MKGDLRYTEHLSVSYDSTLRGVLARKLMTHLTELGERFSHRV